MRGCCALGAHGRCFDPLQKLQQNQWSVLHLFICSNIGLTCIDVINDLGSLEITDAVPMDVDSDGTVMRMDVDHPSSNPRN